MRSLPRLVLVIHSLTISEPASCLETVSYEIVMSNKLSIRTKVKFI